MGTDAVIQECSQWKLLGVAAWHLALYLLGATVWRAAAAPWSQHFLGLFSFRDWLLSLLVYACSLAVLYTQRQVLTTLDVPPLYVSRLGWGGKSWPSLLISRCIIRRRKLRDVADVALFYAACCFSACAGLYLLQPAGGSSSSKAGVQPLLVYGSTLGLLYGIGYLIRGKSVLSFPILQRHRYFRIKQRMRALVKSSLVLPSLALGPAAALSALLAPAAAMSQQQQQRYEWGGAAGVLGLWRAGLLCCYAWAAGGHMLEIVFTERVAMAADDDPQPTAPLLAALQHTDPIVQDWCLLDLAAVAEGAPGARSRRAAIFADETGANGWLPISRYCLAELRDFVAVLAGALPSLQGAAAAGSGVKWNALQLSAAGGRPASSAQDAALWHLQARYCRVVACMRALSGLAAAAFTSDRYGVLHFSSPGLGEVLAAQLGVVAVLTAFTRHSSSIPVRPASAAARLLQRITSGGSAAGAGGPQQHVDAAACALLDTAKTCTYRLTNTYGEVLMSVAAKQPPLVGTAAEAQALLASFLAHQE